MLLRMTRNPNAYPENLSQILPHEAPTDPRLATRFFHRAVAATGAILLLAGCTAGTKGDESAEGTHSPSAEATSPYPGGQQGPAAPQSETPGLPELQRKVLQIECWNHPSVNSFLDVNTPDKVEVDLVKDIKGRHGIVSKILFDVDKEGIDMRIEPTDQEPINRSWKKDELYNNRVYKVDYDNKSLIKYPVWRDAASSADYVTFTIGCQALTPKEETPVMRGAVPVPATIIVPHTAA